MDYRQLQEYNIPERQCIQINECRSISDLYDDRKYKRSAIESGVTRPLNEFFKEKLSNFIASGAEEPEIHLMYHTRHDGRIASLALYDSVREHECSTAYDPQFSANELHTYLKPSAIKRSAGKNKQWTSHGVFGAGFISTTVMFIISSLLTVFFGSDRNVFEVTFPPVLTVLFIVLAALLAVSSVFFLVFKLRANNRLSMEELEDRVKREWTDDEFSEFIDNFDENDFCIFSSNQAFILDLSRYSIRQRIIIQRYLTVLSKRQMWIIFLDASNANSPYLSLDNTTVYRLVDLSHATKRKLAREVEKKQGIKVFDGPLNRYGIDIIFKQVLRDELSDNELRADLSRRLQEFIADKKTDSNIDVENLLYFVTEMVNDYGMDFGTAKNWEYLFEYPAKADGLIELDRRLTYETFFGAADVKDRHIGQLKKMVSDIWREFENDFASIRLITPENERLRAYRQLCYIKAMRVKTHGDDDRLMQLADAILRELLNMDDLDYYVQQDWSTVVPAALGILEKRNYRCYGPHIIHRLLELYDATDREHLPQDGFFTSEILDTARSNLILGPNLTDGSDDADDETAGTERTAALDVIYDHYAVMKRASEERYPEDRSSYGQTPKAFGILRLSESERDEYYNLLRRMGEDDVIAFFENLYDCFCASAAANSMIRLICYELYGNDLASKYGIVQSNDIRSLRYVGVILTRMFELLEKMYASDGIILTRLRELHSIYSESRDEDFNRDILLELADAEFSGISIFSYLICMSARVKGEKRILKNMYLGIGNYLIRLIFLIYHESVLPSFNNDDFYYIVRILSSYDSPGNAILGYLTWCDTYALPSAVRTVMNQYLTSHIDQYLHVLEDTVDDLRPRDIQSFIWNIRCINFIENDDKSVIFTRLRRRLHESFTDIKNFDLLDELLSVIADDRTTERFAALTPEETVDCITGGEANTVYLLYEFYVRQDQDAYLPLCPRVYNKLKNSSATAKFRTVTAYIAHGLDEDEYSDEYRTVITDFVETVDLKCRIGYYSANLSIAIDSSRIFKRIQARCNESAALAAILDRDKLRRIIEKLEEEYRHYLEIEQNTRFFVRLWTRSAIAQYLYYLLTNSTMTDVAVSGYYDMSQEEKVQYVTAHLSSLSPIIRRKDELCVNSVYVDMLDFFINNVGNIQQLIFEEGVWLDRFLEDAKQVVSAVFVDGRRVKEITKKLDALHKGLGRM